MNKKYSTFLWAALSGFLISNATHAENLTDYVTKCKAELGISAAANSIPSFSCTDGVYVSSILQRPGLQSDKNYLGKVNIPSNSNVDAVFLCRDYNQTSNTTATANLNGFILQNRTTGKTCFFDAKVNASGINYPSLDSSSASTRWAEPSAMAGRCTGCHTADPYIVTPALANAFVQLNINYPIRSPNAPYVVVNSGVSGSVFNGWQTDTTNWLNTNNCASACHRLVDPAKAPTSITNVNGPSNLTANAKSLHTGQQNYMLSNSLMNTSSLTHPYVFNFNTDTPVTGKVFAVDYNLNQSFVQKNDTNNTWVKISEQSTNSSSYISGGLAGGNGKFFGLGDNIYAFKGASCYTTGQCPGWQPIYTPTSSYPVTFESNGTQTVIGMMSGNLYRYNGTPCGIGVTNCTSMQLIDQNNWFIHPVVVTGSNIFYQRPDGFLYRYTGTPCSGSNCNGWQMIDNDTLGTDMRRLMTGDSGTLYTIRNTNGNANGVWKYTNTPCSGSTCNGWQRLDNRSTATQISAGGGKLFQILSDRSIWRFTGTACASSSSCTGWVKVRNADANIEEIKVSANGTLYARNWVTSAWLKFTGTSSCSGSSCPGWTTVSLPGSNSYLYVDKK